MADGDRVLLDLQAELKRVKSVNRTISTLARQGNDKLVQDFLTDDFKIQSSGPLAKVSQLYVASFWGLKDSVQHLLDAGTDPSFQNDQTLWTPLHAATFQEHGPAAGLKIPLLINSLRGVLGMFKAANNGQIVSEAEAKSAGVLK
uniref:Uncharacterized protein n=1 Tax=Biomphalaria glabrata TaxID=6526 RepID=A0A2C9LVN5_BIOGL